MTRPDAPFTIEVDDLPPPSAASPADAPPPPEDAPTGAAMVTVTNIAGRRRSRFSGLFWSAAVSLFTLVLSIAAYDYVTSLIARNPTLGMIAFALTAILALVVLLQIIRELWAFRRLARIDGFHKDAALGAWRTTTARRPWRSRSGSRRSTRIARRCAGARAISRSGATGCWTRTR